MSAQGEMWRVSTVEGVFEADLDTLKQWIVEGCVAPTDKVCKGNLSWIDAGRAPMLRGAFNGDVGSTTVAVATTDASAQEPVVQAHVTEASRIESPADSAAYDSVETENPVAAKLATVAADADSCHNHPEALAKYICRICAGTFCDECPRFIGSSKVPLCPLCGDLCRLIGEEREKYQRQEFRSTSFGFGDLGRALCYPWQHKIALVSGALVYGFLQLAGFYGNIFARAIIFGCIARVINQVAWGRLNRSFLPDFSEFSLWDDLVVPLRMALGISIVTWGPAAAIMLVFVFGALGSAGAARAGASQQQDQRLTAEEMQALSDPDADPVKTAAADRKLDQPGYLSSSEGPRSRDGSEGLGFTERRGSQTADLKVITDILKMGLVLLPFFLLSVAWGIFYYPMALTVAGYTESFVSVINPLVGIDTIKRMRGTYFKAFGMVILIQIAGLIVAVIIGIVLSPFGMPFVANMPAAFVGGAMTFYFNLVIACILGLSLHKCADRLGIDVD